MLAFLLGRGNGSITLYNQYTIKNAVSELLKHMYSMYVNIYKSEGMFF